MPRKARKMSATGTYHVILRGINKQMIFEEENDYLQFLGILKLYKPKYNYKVFAFCLMSNHIHLLMQDENGNIDEVMKTLAGTYARWFNKKYERYGQLFQDRFRSEPIDDDRYFLTVFRYIHQNPYKAYMEKRVGEYRWSSYKVYETEKESFVDINEVLELFHNEREKCLNYLQEENNDECLEHDTARRRDDKEAARIIFDISGCKNVAEFQNLLPEKREQFVKMLLMKKLNKRQISRLTGVSKGIIERLESINCISNRWENE